MDTRVACAKFLLWAEMQAEPEQLLGMVAEDVLLQARSAQAVHVAASVLEANPPRAAPVGDSLVVL